MFSISSAASADSASVSKARGCKPSLSARSINTAALSCANTGRTSRSTTMYASSTARNSGDQLALFAGDILASPSAWQDAGVARKMKDISGRRCIALYEKSGRDGSWPKTFMGILASASMRLPHRWKLKASPSGRLLFQLAPLARRTGATDCGLWLTPTTTAIASRGPEAMDKRRSWRHATGHKTVPPGNLAEQLAISGTVPCADMMDPALLPTPRAGKQSGKSGEGFPKTLLETLLPTPSTSDAKGASMKRFRGSPESHGNLREVLRDGPTDGQYPHPAFVEWMMGFPIGWTDLGRSATPSSRKSRRSSGKQS